MPQADQLVHHVRLWTSLVQTVVEWWDFPALSHMCRCLAGGSKMGIKKLQAHILLEFVLKGG